MIEIVIGTNRPNSNSSHLAYIISKLFEQNQVAAQIMDLAQVGLESASGAQYGGKVKDSKMLAALERVNQSRGLVLVVPEYNGSYPGALKYFIDHWSYPESFESRPVAFVGLGGRWAGLRPVEHLQQVFGYRNAYVFPERVFVADAWNNIKNGELKDPMAQSLLESLVKNFDRFCTALQSQSLDAKSKRKAPTA